MPKLIFAGNAMHRCTGLVTSAQLVCDVREIGSILYDPDANKTIMTVRVGITPRKADRLEHLANGLLLGIDPDPRQPAAQT